MKNFEIDKTAASAGASNNKKTIKLDVKAPEIKIEFPKTEMLKLDTDFEARELSHVPEPTEKADTFVPTYSKAKPGSLSEENIYTVKENDYLYKIIKENTQGLSQSEIAALAKIIHKDNLEKNLMGENMKNIYVGQKLDLSVIKDQIKKVQTEEKTLKAEGGKSQAVEKKAPAKNEEAKAPILAKQDAPKSKIELIDRRGVIIPEESQKAPKSEIKSPTKSSDLTPKSGLHNVLNMEQALNPSSPISLIRGKSVYKAQNEEGVELKTELFNNDKGLLKRNTYTYEKGNTENLSEVIEESYSPTAEDSRVSVISNSYSDGALLSKTQTIHNDGTVHNSEEYGAGSAIKNRSEFIYKEDSGGLYKYFAIETYDPKIVKNNGVISRQIKVLNGGEQDGYTKIVEKFAGKKATVITKKPDGTVVE